MKRIKNIVLLFVATLLLGACKKVSDFDGERPDERLAAHLAAYEQLLVEAEYGWIGYLYPDGGGGYAFKFAFDANNRVIMYADRKEAQATTPKESSYRLRATQVPSLYFDTYSYLHELADPDPLKSGGNVGEGQLSDFEFSILSASVDTIRLKGNLNESELILVRATADQGDDYIGKVYAQKQRLEAFKRFPYYYNQLAIGGKQYNITINTQRQTVSFYSNAGSFTSFNTTYVAQDNGIVFQTPFVDGDVRIPSFSDIAINQTAHTATVNVDGLSVSITNAPEPIAIDAEAGQRMYVETYTYASDSAFTVGGEADGLGISAITGYAGTYYIPRRYADGYDAVFVLWNDGYNYVGPALNTRISDGKLFFHNLVGYGNNGLDGFTENDINLLYVLRDQLLDEQGYYVYQTGANSYDLVSVADGRVWIRFY